MVAAAKMLASRWVVVLPLGGDAHDLQGLARPAPDRGCGRTHLPPDVRHDHLRDAVPRTTEVQFVVDEQRPGALVDRGRRERVAVADRAAHAAEEGPRQHGARVVVDSRDLDVEGSARRLHVERVQHVPEHHRNPTAVSAVGW
jgi:hypothetical protein